jgi:threonine dehydrogenase-like Zn-dependent dehydrogenase
VKALVYHGPCDVRLEDVPEPKIQDAGDAVVRIERTAICGSDLHVYHAEALPVTGFALGHEFLGTVEDAGSQVARFRRGDRVLVSCTIGCGRCASCGDGLYSGCATTTALGPVTNIFGTPLHPGGQAEAARVPFADANLLPIPPGLDDEQVLFLTDILPTGWMGAELAEVGPGDVAVVFGCGPVGTFAQRAAWLRGASRVIAVDLDEGRLAKAAARGCLPLHPQREDLLERVRELTAGRGADCAIEAVGRPELVRSALDVVRPGGRVAVIGVITGADVGIPFLARMTGRNLTLRSGIVNPQRHYPELLALIQQGRIDPSEIVTHRLPLAAGVRAYEIFDRHEDDVLKIVLSP